MTRKASAEGRICAICGRGMLAGEVVTMMDHPPRRIFRRSVCPLCRRRALASGWVVSPTIPPRPEFDIPEPAEG